MHFINYLYLSLPCFLLFQIVLSNPFPIPRAPCLIFSEHINLSPATMPWEFFLFLPVFEKVGSVSSRMLGCESANTVLSVLFPLARNPKPFSTEIARWRGLKTLRETPEQAVVKVISMESTPSIFGGWRVIGKNFEKWRRLKAFQEPFFVAVA